MTFLRLIPLTPGGGRARIAAVGTSTLLRLAGAGLLAILPPGVVRGAEIPSPSSASTPIDLLVETLTVGPGGTETLASDEARVLPGRGAVLEKEVTLRGRNPQGKRGAEKVRFRAEIRVDSSSTRNMTLAVRSRANVLADGGASKLPAALTRNALAELAVGASLLFEIYESPSLGAKITLNVRWSPPGDTPAEASETVPISLSARLYEVGKGEPILINENLLSARVGGSASATFSRNVPLPASQDGGKRFRQERVEVTLAPKYWIGREVSLSLAVVGEIITRAAGADLSHPLAHQGDYLLSTDIPISLDLETLADEAGTEGWTRLRYRLEITAVFRGSPP